MTLINDLPDGTAYFVGDQSMIDGMNAAKEGAVDDFKERGWLYTGDTPEDAAKKAGPDPEALQAAGSRRVSGLPACDPLSQDV